MSVRFTNHPGKWMLLLVAIALVSLALASSILPVVGAITGLLLGTAVVLRAPVWVLIAGVVTGPAMGSWLDFSAGGAIPAATIDRALLLAVSVYVGTMVLGRRLTFLPPGRIEAAMGIFGIVAATSLAFRGGSTSEGVGVSGLRLDIVFLAQSYLIPFMYFFLGKNMIQERHLKWILRLYVAVGVFIGIVAALQFLTGIKWFTPTRYKAIHEGRAVGTLQSAPHFGQVMLICVISAAAVIVGSKRRLAQNIAAGAVAIMVAGIALSKTRAVYLGLLAAIAAMGNLIPRTRRAILLGALMGITALIVAWPMISRSDFLRTRLMDPVPVYNRIALWGTAANMVLHKPIAGFGFGQRTFREERADYFIKIGNVPAEYGYSLGATHNEYLHILVTTGLLGFIPYVTILVLLWRRGMRSYRRRDGTSPWETEIAFVAVASLATYLINGFFADLHACWYASNMIFFLFGALEGCEVRRATARAAPGLSPGIRRTPA
jgi:O-antigen ligase